MASSVQCLATFLIGGRHENGAAIHPARLADYFMQYVRDMFTSIQ